MIRNIIFDIGEVLVDFYWRKILTELGLSEESIAHFAIHVFGSECWHALDHGTISDEEAYAHFQEVCKPYAEEFEVVWSNRPLYVAPRTYSVPWIQALKRAGYRVYLLSNYPIVLFEMHKARNCFPFFELVDGAIISAYEREVKPEPGIYQLLMRRYGLVPEECVFLDDREENVAAAKALGFEGIIFTGYEAAVAALHEAGVDC